MSWNLDMRRLAEEEEERWAEKEWAEEVKWIKWELEHPEEVKKIQEEWHLEKMKAERLIRRIAKSKAREERRIVRAQVSATGQVIIMEKRGQTPVIVAEPGSLKLRNTVVSPDGWTTVVPRSGLLDTKTQ